MKRLCVSLLLIIFTATCSMAQFSLEGRVYDTKTEKTLPRVHVSILNSYRATVTDVNGSFRLRGLSPGEHTIRVSHIGYETMFREVVLNEDTYIRIDLSPKAIGMPAIEVQATRIEEKTPLTYTHINKEDIKENNLGRDLPFLMKLTPSTVVTSDAGAGIGYSGIRIRGTDITRINVTINGIPLNDPESQGVFWVNLPDLSSSIENIQIQRGVGTSVNGAAAFGASINIETTRMNADPYAEINSSAGSFNTFKNTLKFGTGLLNGKFTIDGRLSRITSDGYIDRASTDLKSFFVSGGYYGDKSVLKVNIFSGKERTYQAWDGIPSSILDTNRTWNGIGAYTDAEGNERYYENETDNYQQDHYQLIYSRELLHNLTLNTAFFFVHGEGYYEQYKDEDELSDYGIEDFLIGDSLISHSDLIRQKWLDNDYYGMTWSVRYAKDRLNTVIGGSYNSYRGDHFGEIVWARNIPSIDHDERWYFNDGQKEQFNIFLKSSYALADKLNAFGDLQYRVVDYSIDGIHDDLRDISQEKQYHFLNPKVGLYMDLNESQSLYASVAVSNREPTRSDFRDADPGRFPKAERLTDYELGYDLRTDWLKVNANLYYMQYKDQLVLTGEINNVGAPIFTNVPESFRRGIEVMAGIKVLQQLNWEFNLALSENKIQDFTAFVDDWDTWSQVEEDLGNSTLAFSPSVIAGNQITYSWDDKLEAALVSKYVGKQYIDNTENEDRILEAFLVNDLKLSYQLKSGIFRKSRITLMVNNIFNEEYETNAWVYRYLYTDESGRKTEGVFDGYFPQAGRNFLVGLSLGF